MNESSDTDNSNNRTLPQHILARNRSIAEREASRLARPERPRAHNIGHANRARSAVSSTPFGFDTFKRKRGIDDDLNGSGDNVSDDVDGAAFDDWCGPFSVARQMIARREEARRQREEEQRQQQNEQEGENKIAHPLDEIAKQVELEKKRKAHPSMTWKPIRTAGTGSHSIIGDDGGKTPNLYYKRQKRLQKQQKVETRSNNGSAVPTLFQICVKFIVDHFEDVEALGYTVDNSIRRAICEELVAKGKMNGAAFDALAEEGIETLEIVDCTSVTSEQMAETLDVLVPAGLRALILNHAGRCFTSKAVGAIVKHASDTHLIQLFALSISGAYILKDADVAKLISVTAPTLSSIQLKACPLVGLELCNALGTHYASNIGSTGACLLELSLEDVPAMSKGHLLSLASSSNALQHLKSLTLKQMDAVDDDVVLCILSSINSGNLEGLNLSNNVHLTDAVLSSIRKFNVDGQLKSLQLSGIKNLTSAGLEAFFTFDIPGLPHPPSLRTLDLSDCEIDAVNESVVNLAVVASALKRHGSTQGNNDDHELINNDIEPKDGIENSNLIDRETKNDNVSTLGGLVSLDVSGSSVTDHTMENLASYCHKSLKELKLNFCAQVSDNGLGYLVSKAKYQFNRLEIWGCAQITETFLDGHSRIDGGGLEIIGAWMSKGNKA